MNSEVSRYKGLNELAEQNGIVIFGGSEDVRIPLGELRQAFSVEPKMYNRSIAGLSLKDAAAVYEEIAAPLMPETALIHLGEADIALFAEDSAAFDSAYRGLIACIRVHNPKCRVAVVSLRNYDRNPQIDEMNRHLKYIADSEQCEYGDIAGKRVWNPKNTKDVISFVHSIGFVRPLKNRRPLYDLVKMLYCCEA